MPSTITIQAPKSDHPIAGLRINRVGDEGCQVVGNELKKLLKLATLSLDLSSNGIRPQEFVALREKLTKHVAKLKISS